MMDGYTLIGGLLLSAAIGLAIGQSKGRPVAGLIWGFLVGPLGWLLVAIGPNMKPKCPHCGGEIVEGASKCKNCGSDISGRR